MRKWFYILFAVLPMLACVGQKDDPVEEPDPGDPIPEAPGGADEGKDFFRRSLVLDFTGTWCQNCPNMEAAIKTAMETRPGRIIPVSVHCKAIDPMFVKPLNDDLVKQFGVNAYPSAVVDMDPGSLISQSSPELLLNHVDRLLTGRARSAGVRVETTLKGEDYTLKAEMKAVRDGDYTLAVLVLEDGIVAAQTGGTADHVHNNILRSWTEGDPHAGLKEGDTAVLELTGTLAGSCRFVVLVLRNGLVDNVVGCAAGASVDYQYEEVTD